MAATMHKVGGTSRRLRDALPPWVSRAALASPAARAFRHRLGLYATVDAPFVDLDPPVPAPDEQVGPPDFVGIGVQKAGTSWWFDLIREHPSVYHRPFSEVGKERHFFSKLALSPFGEREAAAYHRWFPRADSTITGEWTPCYFYQTWVPALMRQAAPDARLLLILRDPVERFLSGTTQLLGMGGAGLAKGNVHQNAFDRGRYAHQLAAWTEHFPLDQILVLQYERCTRDPAGELSRTFDFLGLRSDFRPDRLGRRVNETVFEKVSAPAEVKTRIADLYRSDVSALAGMLPALDLSLWPNFADL